MVLPKNRGAYYAGAWHEPKAGRFVESINPGTGQSLGKVADSGADDIDAAVAGLRAHGAELVGERGVGLGVAGDDHGGGRDLVVAVEVAPAHRVGGDLGHVGGGHPGYHSGRLVFQ